MFDNEILKYIEDHSDPEPDNLYRLMRATNIHLINGRMCSGHLQGRVLKMLTAMIRPKKVLELGTFSGYSALCIAESLDEDAVLDTVESDDELEDFIKAAFEDSEYGSRIRLHIGDGLHFARQCNADCYDMVFIDADKRNYCEYYDACLRIVRPGGFIIADNTLWDGHVIEPIKTKDSQTAAIIRFNDMVRDDKRVEKVILSLRDGLTLIRKLPS